MSDASSTRRPTFSAIRGKADVPMAGGNDPSQLASALASVERWVADRV